MIAVGWRSSQVLLLTSPLQPGDDESLPQLVMGPCVYI